LLARPLIFAALIAALGASLIGFRLSAIGV